MTFTGERFAIVSGDHRAEIAEAGASLAGFWHQGAAITVELPDDALPPKSAGAVLLPWPNRIRDGKYTFDGTDYQLALTEPAAHNASHGFAKWSRWAVTEHETDSVTLELRLVPQTGYPFELMFTLRYSVGESGLSVEVSALNTGATAAPFGAGFHPYLDLGSHVLDTAELEVPAATVLHTDDQQIPVSRAAVADSPFDFRVLRPIGDTRVDHAFTDLTGPAAVLRTAERTVSLHVDAGFGYLQVFTPPFITPGRNAVAIEPMSCPANAFNSGEALVRLEPGADWHGSWGITVG